MEALALTLAKYGCPKQITLDRDPRWVGSPMGSDFPAALLRFGACQGIAIEVWEPHHPQQNGFVERYNRTYQQECLALDRPRDLSQAKEVTESFVQHYNYHRPHQGLSCGNRPPRTACATLPTLEALPSRVDPDSWLKQLDGKHLVRKVDKHGTVRIDLKCYDVSSQLVGHHVVLHVDSQTRCLQVLDNQQLVKSLPLKGLVGRVLSYEQFLTHMLHQARSPSLALPARTPASHGRFRPSLARRGAGPFPLTRWLYHTRERRITRLSQFFRATLFCYSPAVAPMTKASTWSIFPRQ